MFEVGDRVYWHDPAIGDYDNPQEALERVFVIEEVDNENETAWIREEDYDGYAQTEVYTWELELVED
jgi:hypothetical protein